MTRRTLLVLGGVMAASVALTVGVAVLVVHWGFLQLEEQSVRGDVAQAVAALRSAVDQVDAIATDWATWDDAYAFVETADPAWTRSNLVPESLAAIRVTAVVVADQAGRAVAQIALDPETLGEVPVPQPLVELLTSGSPLARSARVRGWSGLVRRPDGRIDLVAARPILRSNRQGPSRGALLVARSLDSGEVQRLAELTGLAVTVRPSGDPGTDAAFRAWLASEPGEQEALIERVSPGAVAGSALLRDVSGRPVAVLRAEGPRSLVRHERRSLLLLGAIVLLSGLAMTVVALPRLAHATRRVDAEITRRRQAEERALLAETRYRHTIDQAIEGFYRTTIDGRIELVNPALAGILGFGSAEELAQQVIGSDYEPYVVPERRATLIMLLEKRERVIGFESELRRRDGSVIWVSENVRAVRDADGRLRSLEGSMVDITDRKRAVQALQASEARYRELADFLPQPVFELDRNGVPSYVNQAARSWYGPGVEGMMVGGEALLDLVVQEQRGQAFEAFSRALAGERRGGIELTAVRGDGERVPVLVFASPIERDGRLAGARILAVDISAQKRVEDALRDSEQKQAAMLRSLPVAVYTSQIPSEIDATWISDGVKRFTGFPAERYINEPRFWSARIHPDDALRVAREYRLGAVRGEVTVEYRWQIADGSYRWFVDSALRTGQHGGVTEMTGILRDITVEKEAEEAIRRSERYYHGLFEGAHDAILVYHPETRQILDANSAACAAYQVPRGQLVGMSLDDVSTNIEEERKQIAATLARGSVQSFETTHLRGDGSRVTFDVNASVVEFHGRRAILSVNRDVTERRVLEERLRHAERMEAMGRLATGVAHDFNNVLAIILGHAEAALRRSESGEQAVSEAEVIREAALRGRDLTQSLLGFTRHQIIQRQNLDFGSLVEGMLPIVRGALPTSISVRVTGTDRPLTVCADHGQIQQILLNLAVNARDAMPDGGELELEIASVEIGEDSVSGHPWAQPGRYVRLRVRDTGTGMDEKVVARALDPFFTTKGSSGTGLGLASVYGIAQQHGGMVEISSTPGRGTVVDVYLPEAEGPPVERDARPVSDEVLSGRGERILLAEDEPMLRNVVGALLAELGYEVSSAADGEEALAAMVDSAEPFDLIVTDLTMPRMGGLELYRASRERGLGAAFLFTSGHDEKASRVGIPDDPRVAFLNKPYSMATVAPVLRELLERNG